VSAVDDTSGSAPVPDGQTQATGLVCLPVDSCAAWRSSKVTSTRSTPSQLWQIRLNDSGCTICRAIACRCPQHSHVTTARIFSPRHARHFGLKASELRTRP